MNSHDEIHHYEFDLPPDLIAAEPTSKRTESRLLVLNRAGDLEHRKFSELPEFMREGDLLVMNNSRVVPARLRGTKITGGSVELLLIDVLSQDPDRWENPGVQTVSALCRASKSPKVGQEIILDFGSLEVIARHEDGLVELRGEFPNGILAELTRHGEMPLPPYIVKRREGLAVMVNDSERYQTVYAQTPGSVAAPTAGLHFDQTLLQTLEQLGVQTAFVTLDVGPGTFRPVSGLTLSSHVMHFERYSIGSEAASVLQEAKSAGRRVFAVGTTTTRVLEAEARLAEPFLPGRRETNLFMRPGNGPRYVDHLITNFHLPASTLLALVASFTGLERMQTAYECAIAERYRFYSYGDAMLIL